MPDYLIYGKIHIDHILHVSQEQVFLGGGGPQAVFGALVWSNRIGFLSRSGVDIEPRFVTELEATGADLAGWTRMAHLPTPHTFLEYDANEYLIAEGIRDPEAWLTMMRTPIPVPNSYRTAKAIHLITEWADTAMVQSALEMKAATGCLFSLEPIIDYKQWTNRQDILNLLPQVDVVTPDWPSASGIAGSSEPREVLRFWTKLGTKLVAIRHGAQGAYLWSQAEDKLWHLPPVPVDEVVDPTGAGNAFGGGLFVGWQQSGDARIAGSYGGIAARLLLEQPGIPAISEPLRARARALLERTIASAREF